LSAHIPDRWFEFYLRYFGDTSEFCGHFTPTMLYFLLAISDYCAFQIFPLQIFDF